MRISILSNLYPPKVLGGAELSASFTARVLAGRGHEVSVITLADADSTSTEDGVRIHRIRSRPFYSPFYAKKKPGWMKPVWHAMDAYNPLMGGRVRDILAAEKPEVLHCHNIVGFSVSAWEAARSASVPVVQHLHDYHLVCIKATLLNEKLEACPNPHFPCSLRARYHFRMLERGVGHVISPSAFCADKVFGFSRNGAGSCKVSIIPNGTDFSDGPPLRSGWDGGEFRVLYLGGLFEHKGFLLFRDAIERLNRSPNRFRFEIGGAGPFEGAARELAARHPNVTFHGFVGGEKKLGLFRDSHLFLFPSIWLENNPVSVTEALAIGLPVLGSDIGGVPELLAPVSRELLLAPGSAEAIADKLVRFAEDRSLLRDISGKLLANRQAYSLEKQVDAVLEVYREAAAGRP